MKPDDRFWWVLPLRVLLLLALVIWMFYVRCNGAKADIFSSQAWGDNDCNGQVDIGDAVYLLNYIFAGGPEPCAQQQGDLHFFLDTLWIECYIGGRTFQRVGGPIRRVYSMSQYNSPEFFLLVPDSVKIGEPPNE